MESIPDFLDFYSNNEIAPTVLSPEWHMWSMIHSMFESFDLIVYNGSHKIDENQETHLASRCVLKFPQEPNMFVLFHGNLVHSGAKAKPEPGKNSLNYACNLRAFFYISKFDTKCKRAARRDNTSGIKLCDTHANDASLGTTYVGCPKMANMFGECGQCNKYENSEKGKYLTSNGFEIDLKKLYKEYKKKRKKKMEPIAGDLYTHGWAVYEGVNTSDVKEVGNLFGDCRDLVNMSIVGVNWTNIPQQAPYGTARKKLKLCEHEIMENKEPSVKIMSTTYAFYRKCVNECLIKVEGFENAKLTGGSLLCNKSHVTEQNPHRDYKPKPKGL